MGAPAQQEKGLAIPVFILLMLLVGSLPAPAAAQGSEVEPNDDCMLPQAFGSVAYPFTVEGSLDSTPEDPDVDFFLFASTPGAIVTVDLEGEFTGAGTLADPLMGIFDAVCTSLATADDGGSGNNSRLQVIVPADGMFAVAATAYPDFWFTGGGVGSYRLTVGSPEPLVPIGSISARVVDAADGRPLVHGEPSFVWVDLSRCSDPSCGNATWITSTITDAEGRFRFEQDWNGNPLPVGTYVLFVAADGYELDASAPFAVQQGEHRDVGDIAVDRLGWIGSISGRLVDSESGQGLSGDFPSWARASICRLEGTTCSFFQHGAVDDQGYFSFDGLTLLLRPGRYLVVGEAEQYESAWIETAYIAVAESVNVGELALTPWPIRVLATYPCADLPGSGGTCRFGARLQNRLATVLQGQVWTVFRGSTASPVGWTEFQVGRNGAAIPVPQRLVLPPFAETTVEFQVQVPGEVPFSWLCGSIMVGLEPNPLFNTAAIAGHFCFEKRPEGVEVLSAKESRRRLRALERELRRPSP
ncbi:MAG TPA: carboxypeptidase-like regulatory domain-containing protein [Thermoanaerobaculia bacterium]